MERKRNLYLVSGVLVLLFVGLIYAWSIFITPLENLYGWDRAETSNIFTISMISFCLSGILSGYLLKRKSSQLILRISAVLMFAGFTLCFFTDSLIGIYIFYGLLCSIGVGFTYNATLSTVIKWFPDKRSFCSGMLLMGFGAGGFILGNAAKAVINNFGVKAAFIVFAAVSLIVIFGASFFIFAPKHEPVESMKSADNNNENGKNINMLKTSTFWHIFLLSTFASAGGLAIIGQAAPMVESIGLTGQATAFAVGVCSVFNGLGRVLIGLVYSKYKNKTIMFGIIGTYFTAMLILIYSMLFSNVVTIFIGLALLGLSFGAVPSFTVSMVGSYFGSENYSVNISILNIHLLFASLLGSSLTGKIVQMTNNYVFLLIAAIIYIVLASLFVFMFKENNIKTKN